MQLIIISVLKINTVQKVGLTVNESKIEYQVASWRNRKGWTKTIYQNRRVKVQKSIII